MNPKYFRIQLPGHQKISTCPWCENINNHLTGNTCQHVAKVTKKHIVYYYWGIRPLTGVPHESHLPHR